MDASFWSSAVAAGWASFLAATLTVVLGVYGVLWSFRKNRGRNFSIHGIIGLILVAFVIIFTAYGSWKSTSDAITAENETKAQMDKIQRLRYPLIVRNLELRFQLTYAAADKRLSVLYEDQAQKYSKPVDTTITGKEANDALDKANEPSHLSWGGYVLVAPITDRDKDPGRFLPELGTASRASASADLQLLFDPLATGYERNGGSVDRLAARSDVLFDPINKKMVFRIQSKEPYVVDNEGHFQSLLDLSSPFSGDVMLIIVVEANPAFAPPEIANVSLLEVDTGEVVVHWGNANKSFLVAGGKAAYVFFVSEADKRLGSVLVDSLSATTRKQP
jgi:hypothetical protein